MLPPTDARHPTGRADVLRHRVPREGRSTQEVAREAVREELDRTRRRELLDEELPRRAAPSPRLGG